MFQTIEKLSRQNRNLPDNTETFQTMKQLSNNPEMFQTIQKLSRQYGNLPDNTETLQTIKQFAG